MIHVSQPGSEIHVHYPLLIGEITAYANAELPLPSFHPVPMDYRSNLSQSPSDPDSIPELFGLPKSSIALSVCMSSSSPEEASSLSGSSLWRNSLREGGRGRVV